MARGSSRNNVLAGVFIVASLVLAVVMAFTLASISGLGPTTPYKVRFSVQDGAVGLKKGSDVQLGGQLVGKVTKVELAKAPGPDGTMNPEGIDVSVELLKDLVLYKDAKFSLERPLLGSLTTINIWSVGDASGKAGRLEPGQTIKGGLAPPSFLAQAGIGPDVINKIPEMISDARDTLHNFKELTETNRPKIDETVENIRQVSAEVRGKAGDWTKAGDRIVANAENFSQRLGPWMDKADGAVADAKAFSEGLDKALSDNRPKIDQIIGNAAEVTERFKTQTMDRVDAAVAAGKDALEEFRTLAMNVGGLVTEEKPNIEKMLANARLATDQLKLAMVEIRAQPWRLLYRPSKKETEQELLYDSARAYATAVSDLRATSESLSAVLEAAHSGASPEQAKEIEALRTRLREKFQKYDQVERDLLDRMIKESK